MVTVRGADLACTDVGRGGAFLWGHGLCSSRAQEDDSPMLDWTRLTARHRVVRWDARGHGQSSGSAGPDQYRWDNLGRDLVGLADALGVAGFAAGGVSMGAATALHAATQAPERVRALVLVLAPTAFATRAAQAAEYRAGADLVERAGFDAYIQHTSAEPVPAIVASLADEYHFRPAVAEPWLPAVLRGAATSDLPGPDAVRAVTAPTLLLAWDTDPGHPLSTSEQLAELLPHAELEIARRLREVGTWTDRVDAFLMAAVT